MVCMSIHAEHIAHVGTSLHQTNLTSDQFLHWGSNARMFIVSHLHPIPHFSPTSPHISLTQLLYRRALRLQRNIKQLRLPGNHHASLTSKLEVCSGSAGVDLTDEFSGCVVHPDTVAGTGVDAALGIGVDACEFMSATGIKCKRPERESGKAESGQGKGKRRTYHQE